MGYHLETSPDMKLIGRTGTRPAEPLTVDLKSLMDSAIQGAVIVSFGSIVKEISGNVLNKLEETFKEKEELKFILCSDNGTKIVGNVMYLPWIPQNDLLGHINTKIFITHFGDKGQFEALYHGVPMIGVFGKLRRYSETDQWHREREQRGGLITLSSMVATTCIQKQSIYHYISSC